MNMEVLLKKLTHLMKKAMNLILLWLGLQGDDDVLFMAASRFTTKCDSGLSRTMPAMLYMKSHRG
jgi:hypothetical protein